MLGLVGALSEVALDPDGRTESEPEADRFPRGVVEPCNRRNEDDLDTDGRDPGVVEPWFGRGGRGFPEGFTSSRYLCSRARINGSRLTGSCRRMRLSVRVGAGRHQARTMTDVGWQHEQVLQQVFECVWLVLLFYTVIFQHFQYTLLPSCKSQRHQGVEADVTTGYDSLCMILSLLVIFCEFLCVTTIDAAV